MIRISKILVFSSLFCFISFYLISFAEQLNRIVCPCCGENRVIILDDEYGVCQCESCEEILLIVNRKVKLEDGTELDLKDLYDIDALISEIESYNDDTNISSNNYREYLEEDDDGEESYFEENDDSYVSKKSNSPDIESSDGDVEVITSSKKKYKTDAEILLMLKKDFSDYEPENEQEILDMIAKYKGADKNSKDNNYLKDANILVATKSILTKDNSEDVIKLTTKIHVVRYYTGDIYEGIYEDLVFNGIEYTLKELKPRNGKKLLYWELKSNKNVHLYPGEKVIFYNFNKESLPTERIFDFIAVWEISDEK